MRNRRQTPEINAGSMADIAFLLLIFWLVATTITPEYGWKNTLVDEEDEPKIARVTESKDIMRIYIKENTITVNDLEIDGDEDLQKALTFLKKRSARAIVIISADYGASYESYTGVVELIKLNKLKIIYNEIKENDTEA